MLQWYILTRTAFDAAVQANKVTDDMMIFLSDTHEIYRGTQVYSESTVLFTGTAGSAPTGTAARGKLYINSTTLEGWVYNGATWTQAIKAVAGTVEASNTTTGVTGKAVVDYVASEIGKANAEVTELEATVAANKAAAEKAVADEAAAREAAVKGVQSSVTANTEDIAEINETIGGLATKTELNNAKSDLQTKLDTANGKITANEQAIAKLNGDASTDGSVLNTINDVLAQLVGDGTQETIDSLTELVNWANEHAGDVVTLENNVAANTEAIEALEGLVGADLPDSTSATTVIAYIAEVAADLAKEVEDRAEGDTALDGKISALNTSVTNLTKTVGDNKTAIEAALAAETSARNTAIAEVKEDVNANTEAIASINSTIGSLATTAAVNQIKAALETDIAAKMTKVGTGKTGQVIVADANGDASASGKVVGGNTFGSNQNNTLATEAGVAAHVTDKAVLKTAVVTTLDAAAPSNAEVPSESAVVAALTWKTSI